MSGSGNDEAERQRVADELRRIRESVREGALLERAPGNVLPQPLPLRTPPVKGAEAEPTPPPAPGSPDGAAVNSLWDVGQAQLGGGLRGLLARGLRFLL